MRALVEMTASMTGRHFGEGFGLFVNSFDTKERKAERKSAARGPLLYTKYKFFLNYHNYIPPISSLLFIIQ